MLDMNKIRAIAILNNEMLDVTSKLKAVIKKKDSKELDRLKGLILNLQKKISELLK
jgi:hypothetical protein